jgi:hypothetical protein
VKCLKFGFGHYMTSVAETPQMQQGGALAGGTHTSRPTDRVKDQLRLSAIAAGPVLVQCHLANGTRDASARSRDIGLQPAARRIAMIAKIFSIM